MASPTRSEGKIFYQCVWCNKIFEKEKLSRVAETRCPYCGFNVIMKAKPFRAKLLVTSELTKEQRILTG
ncbi:MAG: hypothetical protein QXK95_03805 [Nitrososphaerota archaeon]|nr:hypothetical protein [Candidatus Geocrenenecus dongiae]